MKTLKKSLMIALAIGSLSLGVMATTGAVAYQNREGHDPAKMVDRMKEKLGLSDAQVVKIKQIYENNKATMEADHNAIKAAANDDAKKAAFQKMRGDMENIQAQVQPVLTADQLQKWNEMKAKHEGKGQWGHRGDADANGAQPSK
jgi:hypothetical protein